MTLYLPTEEEATEGIGAWDDTSTQQPASTHDELEGQTVAAFELDRIARTNEHYLCKLLSHRDCGASRVNGSIGGTTIAGPVNVNRGAW